jgi:hypothetical protein
VHAFNGEVEARDHAADAMGKFHGLCGTHFGLAVRSHDRLAVRSEGGLRVIIPGVKLYAVSGAPAGVLYVPDLLVLAERAGAELCVLILEREGGLNDSARGRNAGRQFDGACCGGGGCRSMGCRRCGLGSCWGLCGKDGGECGCRDKQRKTGFHYFISTPGWLSHRSLALQVRRPGDLRSESDIPSLYGCLYGEEICLYILWM